MSSDWLSASTYSNKKNKDCNIEYVGFYEEESLLEKVFHLARQSVETSLRFGFPALELFVVG